MNKTKTKPENGDRANGTRQRRKTRRGKDEEDCGNILKQVWVLPDDITLEIFSKLPIKTLTRCRCVCRFWRQCLSGSVFTKSLSSRAPAFLFLDNRNGIRSKKNILVDIEGDSIPNDMVLKLPDPNALYNRFGTTIICSCNGFLCLLRFNYKIRNAIFNISNPITGESIPLPVDETLKTCDLPLLRFGFGFSPRSDLYKVVLFRTYEKREGVLKKNRGTGVHMGLEVMVLTVGSGIWRRIGKVYASVFHTIYGVFHDGFIHWICRDGVAVLSSYGDVETERFKDMPMPFDSSVSSYTKSYIGVLKSSLSITSCSNDTFSVWIMKEHGIAKSWTKELEIGDLSDWNGQVVIRGTYAWSILLRDVKGLKFLDEGEVLLLHHNFYNDKLNPLIYRTARRNMLRVGVDGTPLEDMPVVGYWPCSMLRFT